MEINFPKTEEKILKFWQKNQIFEKSVKKRAGARNFVFYEGPPTANGRPGIHHVLARVFKDIICRYKTMQGFKVERKAGWDTHGLPVELEVEKELKLKSKKDIERYGIAEFNQKCKQSVWKYKEEWEKLTERIGFWLDMKNPYITYETNYIETIWWIIKEVWEKELLYQDYKVVPYCPRCGTSLSSHEVALGYKKVKEPAVFIKFRIKNPEFENAFLLVWTTTPWTLPGNVAVAVNPDFVYAKVKVGQEYLILAKERMADCQVAGEIVEELRGKDLIGLRYEPPYLQDEEALKNAYAVIPADFVSLTEGTGLVHMAPAFGEEDMAAIKAQNLNLKSQNLPEFPVLLTVDEEGKFTLNVKKWAGMFVKTADPLIIQEIEGRNLLFRKDLYEHDYPFCWRCGSPLLYYAKKSWFIRMAKVKKDLVANNEKINWVPSHLKNGRFGEWLRDVKDWAISRERYWGTPLPIWQCEKCQKQICVGSVKELAEKSSGVKIVDLHRPFIDNVFLKCECGAKMSRVPEVLDCWFDSGAMPFAQYHYPFQNKKLIDPSKASGRAKQFPADYICEAVDQTRGWFYTLLAVSTLLGTGSSYKNVISLGHVLDERGEKMSKSKGNVVNPWETIDKYGIDATRWYFYTINQPGEPKLFSEKNVGEALKKFILIFWNSFVFYKTYSGAKKEQRCYKTFRKLSLKELNVLDRWIISRLHNLIFGVSDNLDNYDVISASRLIESFVVNDLSQWYIRRSRRRFQKPETQKELEDASKILGYVLFELSVVCAPFIPFLSEEIYGKIQQGGESVHLTDWPKSSSNLIDKKLEEKMEKIREIVNLALAERAKTGIKVRQPLASLKIKCQTLNIKENELLDLIKEEVNVKEVVFSPKIKKEIELDAQITPELKKEGIIREVVRNIQEMRKAAKLKPKDDIAAKYSAPSDLNKILADNKTIIMREANLKDFIPGKRTRQKFTAEKEAKIDGQKLWLAIEKI